MICETLSWKSFEAYVSTASNPITDASALHAIKLIAAYLPKVGAHQHHYVILYTVYICLYIYICIYVCIYVYS